MPEANRRPRRFRHFLLDHNGRPERYTSPQTVVSRFGLPERGGRSLHGTRLKQAVDQLALIAEGLHAQRQSAGLTSEFGLLVEFESDPDFLL